MGKLQLGKLQHKVSFYRDAIVVNATTGEQEETLYAVKENRWGSVKYIGSPSAGSSEEEINDQRTGKMKIEVQCRFFSGLRFEDWISFEGGKFRIYSIQTLGRNEGYSLRAELRDDDTNALPTGALMNGFGDLPAVEVVPELTIDHITGLQDTLDLAFVTMVNNSTNILSLQTEPDVDLTAEDIETLNHFVYDPATDKLVADRAIETTLNSLFLGEQHKMSSGAENIFFTNLGTDINFYPMWGGLRDQSLTANQGPTGYISPSARVYTDMFSVPLGGTPDPLNSMGYSGPNYFAVNIAGLGITTVAAEQVSAEQHLEYRLSVNGKQVYLQKLKDQGIINVGQQIEWFFDHPVEIHAGTTIFAEIRKVTTADDTDNGVFQVQRGQTPNADGSFRYQAIVHNRLFEDKELEFISPLLKYQALDVKLDSTGASVLLGDLTQTSGDQFIQAHPVNTLEAVANGTKIEIKAKNGKKVIVESMPVTGATIDGVAVNSVLADAVTSLNNVFTNTSAFRTSGGGGNDVSALALAGNTLTLTLTDGTTFPVDVTTLGVDTNSFVGSGALTGTTLILTLSDSTTVNIDASSLAIDENVTVSSGTVTGTDLVLTMSDSSTVTVGMSALAIDTDTTVSSGSVSGNNLTLTMSDSSTVVLDVTSLALNNNDTVASGIVSGDNLTLTLTDGSTVVIDVTSLATDLNTDTNTTVSSGAVSGTNLVLTMSDGSTVTIDATSMVNGSADTSLAPDVSNQSVTVTENGSINSTIALDSGSDLVNMYGETDAPSWVVLNQSTGQFLGTAPAFISGGTNSYVVNCKAANVLGGIKNFTVTFVVEEVAYTNTKSLFFENAVSSYLAGNAALNTSMVRSGNGSGSSDAWTLSMWVKLSTNTNGQTLFYFGDNDVTNGGHIEIRRISSGGNPRLRLRYGSGVNYLQLQTPNNSSALPVNQWVHLAFTYDGGTTGASSGSVSSYYSRFKIFINGSQQTLNASQSNYGWSSNIDANNYRFGKYLSGNYPRDVYYNQMAIWGSDQSSNINGIYNGGAVQDLTDSTTMNGAVNGAYLPPAHYYEIESSVTSVMDLKGTAHLVGYNFSSSDLVSDTP